MKKEKIIRLGSYLLYILIFLFALAIISSKFSPKGFYLLTVQSGSMEPAIRTGSLIVVKSQGNYQKENIITFYSASGSKDTTTHRIVAVIDGKGERNFQTQGDANGTPDGNLIPESRVIGRVIGKVPYAGYAVAFARTLPGLVIIIIIPATIIVYEEMKKIHHETKHIIHKRREKKLARPIEKEAGNNKGENNETS